MEKLSLVIVDDEEEILKSLKRLFRRDYSVQTFSSAEDFLHFVSDNPVDIVLSDIRMPYMDGFELMAILRRDYPQIVRLCISGYADLERSQKAIENGLFEYIVPKPWESFELKQIVKVYAEKKRLSSELALLKSQLSGS